MSNADVGLRHAHAGLADVALHHVTAGEGPAVVLLHGSPQTWYMWRDPIPVLARHVRDVAPDLRTCCKPGVMRAGFNLHRAMAQLITSLQ